MDDSTSPAQRQVKQERPLLVVQAKLKRMVISSIIAVAVLGALVLILLSGPPTAHGKPDYRASGTVAFLLLMPISVAFFFWARYALRTTLTATHLYVREPGWRLVRTTKIPLRTLRQFRMEKRYVSTGRGGYYRDFLVIVYDARKPTMSEFLVRPEVLPAHDIWMLLTLIKKHAPQVKFDADARRFLDG